MDLMVLFALPGIMLLIWGIVARRRQDQRPIAPSLPPAKIEDGRAFPFAAYDAPVRAGTARIVLGILLAVGGGFFGLVCDAFRHWPGMSNGRPLRVHGRPRLSRRARGTGWHDDARPGLERMTAWTRVRLGERWLAAARAEHASVPAFRQLGNQLGAAGAPASLVLRCELAAADEIRHARRCFALARAYAGIDWTAGELPRSDAAAVDLPALAVESLIDGCLGEGIAADLARAGAGRAADPVIAESLEMIANDEAVHAELAWDVVAFCLGRGDGRVGRALTAAARAIRAGASPGPIDLPRAACRDLARARVASVRTRLATLMPA